MWSKDRRASVRALEATELPLRPVIVTISPRTAATMSLILITSMINFKMRSHTAAYTYQPHRRRTWSRLKGVMAMPEDGSVLPLSLLPANQPRP